MAENLDRILSCVTRIAGVPCRFILNTDKEPFQGGQRIVFALESRDGKRYAVRVERDASEALKPKLEWEIGLLRSIEDRKIHHLPFLAGYELQPAPPLTITNWVNGVPLEWSDITPARNVRKLVIQTIAEVTLNMLKIQSPGTSALDWITNKIVRTRIKRAEQGQLHGVSLVDAESLAQQVSQFHIPRLDLEPHVLIHGDLQPSNMIMNEEKLQSVIDLGCATMVPLQFATLYPKFLTNEPREAGHTFDWSQCYYSQVQIEDRRFFRQCIKDAALTRGHDAQVYSSVLAMEDQEDRHWWLSAVYRVDMMKALKSKPETLYKAAFPH